jgi:hypothetical protein
VCARCSCIVSTDGCASLVVAHLLATAPRHVHEAACSEQGHAPNSARVRVQVNSQIKALADERLGLLAEIARLSGTSLEGLLRDETFRRQSLLPDPDPSLAANRTDPSAALLADVHGSGAAAAAAGDASGTETGRDRVGDGRGAGIETEWHAEEAAAGGWGGVEEQATLAAAALADVGAGEEGGADSEAANTRPGAAAPGRAWGDSPSPPSPASEG